MPDRNYEIRPMTRDEVDLAVEWAAGEGWNPGLADAACFAAADRQGFLVGLLDDEPIATISAVRYGATFGFVGFYIVRPDRRGQGHGLALWNAALEHLQSRTVGLDGVVAQQDNYRKSGFELAYRNIRYEGRGAGRTVETRGVVPLTTVPFESVVDYDRPFFPDDRTAFLQAWISQDGAHALGLVDGERLTGYGVVRPCRSGWKIGPLFADTAAGAETLFADLQSRVGPDEPLFLDVPEANPAAVALAERHGMQVVFETARMYRGPAPELPLERLFGVTSFELG